MAKSSGKGNWVTINGTHVLIDGNKKIISGPKNLIGMTPRQAIGLDPVDSKSDKSSASKSPASKAMDKAKSDREADPSKEKKADGLVERAKRQTAKSTTKKSQKSTNQDEIEIGKSSEYYEKLDEKTLENKLTAIEKAYETGGYDPDLLDDEYFIIDAVLAKKNVAKRKSSTSNTTKLTEPSIGKNTDYTKLTKKEISKGMQEVEKRLDQEYAKADRDPYLISALEDIWMEADEALGTKSYAKSSPKAKPNTGNSNFDNATSTKKVTQTKKSKNSIVFNVKRTDGTTVKMNEKEFSAFLKEKQKSNTPAAKTGNSNFDNATKINKATSGKTNGSASKGLEVTHFDGWNGSHNEYRINGKRVSAKEAKAQFPKKFDSKGRYKG